jgi:hypothetical protein
MKIYQTWISGTLDMASAAQQKINCECGSVISTSSKYAHKKSLKHAWYVWYEEQKRQRQGRGNGRNEPRVHHIEDPEFYEYEVEEQAIELRRYESEQKERQEQKENLVERKEREEREKREEQEEREKRSMPRHIVALVFDKLEKSCIICYEDLTLENVFMTKCGHAMCTSCENKLYSEQRKECPTCRTEYH